MIDQTNARNQSARAAPWLSAILGVGWMVLLAFSVNAVAKLGVAGAVTTFFGDYVHPWRAQFYTDFTAHIFLVAAWIAWRAPSRLSAIVCCTLEIAVGGTFTLAYVAVLIWKSKGDIACVLLGAHNPAVTAM